MDTDIITLRVEAQEAGARLDKFCADRLSDLSRERIKSFIQSGDLTIEGYDTLKPSVTVEEGMVISLALPEAEEADPQPENIPLDILYEDDDLIVINKAAGMVVHPAVGHRAGTLVNALLYHCGDSLSGIGGVKRPGIVHRLDKDTSGVMLVAKNDHAHAHLSAQLADRTLRRVYHALVWDVPVPLVGTIDMAIGRDHKNRLKQAVKRSISGNAQAARHAVTHYKILESYHDAYSLVECRLETGRTHQIRVHMQARGSPLIGDPLYGAQKTFQISRAARIDNPDLKQALLDFSRQALHAKEISFVHPKYEKELTFVTDMSYDINILLN